MIEIERNMKLGMLDHFGMEEPLNSLHIEGRHWHQLILNQNSFHLKEGRGGEGHHLWNVLLVPKLLPMQILVSLCFVAHKTNQV